MAHFEFTSWDPIKNYYAITTGEHPFLLSLSSKQDPGARWAIVIIINIGILWVIN